MYMYHTVINSSPVDGKLGCFHFLASVNGRAVSMCKQISL